MKYKSEKISVENLLFYISYSFNMFYWMFSNVTLLHDFRIVTIKIANICLVFGATLCITHNKGKNILLIMLYLIIAFLSAEVSGSNSILILFLFFVAMKQIEFKKVLKFDFYIKIVFLICILVFYKLGLTENYYMYRSDGKIRSSMGFGHPNIFGTYIFLLCCEYVYLYYKKMRVLNYIVLIVLSFVVYRFSNSRTAQVGILCLICISFFYDKGIIMVIKNKFVFKLIKYLFIILSIISYLLGILYIKDNQEIIKINSITSNRIQMIALFIDEYDINFFGNNIKLLGTKAAQEERTIAKVLDNSYIRLLLQYGILTYILLAVFFTSSMKKALREKDYMIILLLILYSIYGLMENVLILLQYNVFLLYFSNVIYTEGEKNEKIEKVS